MVSRVDMRMRNPAAAGIRLRGLAVGLQKKSYVVLRIFNYYTTERNITTSGPTDIYTLTKRMTGRFTDSMH